MFFYGFLQLLNFAFYYAHVKSLAFRFVIKHASHSLYFTANMRVCESNLIELDGRSIQTGELAASLVARVAEYAGLFSRNGLSIVSELVTF